MPAPEYTNKKELLKKMCIFQINSNFEQPTTNLTHQHYLNLNKCKILLKLKCAIAGAVFVEWLSEIW